MRSQTDRPSEISLLIETAVCQAALRASEWALLNENSTTSISCILAFFFEYQLLERCSMLRGCLFAGLSYVIRVHFTASLTLLDDWWLSIAKWFFPPQGPWFFFPLRSCTAIEEQFWLPQNSYIIQFHHTKTSATLASAPIALGNGDVV